MKAQEFGNGTTKRKVKIIKNGSGQEIVRIQVYDDLKGIDEKAKRWIHSNRKILQPRNERSKQRRFGLPNWSKLK